MGLLKNILMAAVSMLGLLGWMVFGLLVLLLSPLIIGIVVIGAVIFAPDMDGY
jgi:hypothetical protein